MKEIVGDIEGLVHTHIVYAHHPITNQKFKLEEYNTLNNKKEGSYRRYYPDGKVGIECNYKNGIVVGEYKRFNEDGSRF